MGYATKEELAEVKSMIEEIKAMIKDKEEMSEEVKEETTKETDKEELSTDKQTETVMDEKVILEKVTHNPEAEAKKDLNLYSQRRKANTMDRVLSKIANIKK